MFDRRRVSTVLAVVALGLMLAPVLVVATPAPSSALAGACPPGAPPDSSLCTPSGWAIYIDQGWATLAQARAAGVILPEAAGVAASAAGTAGPTLAAAVAGMGGLVVSQTGLDAFQFDVDLDSTDLELVESGGWSHTFPGGALSLNLTFDLVAETYDFTVTAGGAGWASDSSSAKAVGPMLADYFGYDAAVRETIRLDYEALDAVGNVVASGMVGGRPLSWTGFWGLDGNWGRFVSTRTKTDLAINRASGTDAPVAIRIKLKNWDTGQLLETWSTDDVPDPGFTGVLTSQVQCQGPTGGPRSFQQSQAVKLTPDDSTIDFPGVECDAGEVLSSLVIEWVTDTGNETLYSYTAPEWVTDIPVEFPNCVNGDCGMTLWQVFADAPAEWCGGAAVGCQNWWQDANKLDHYECRYGGTAVDLGSCSMFRNPGTITPNTSVHVDADGNLVGSTTPVTSLNPSDYEDLDKIIVDVTVPVDDPDIGQAVDVGFGCMPEGWGKFNPIEWVARPVGCALVWAFVPETGAITEGINEALDGSILGQIGTEFDAFSDIHWPEGSTSCEPLYRGTPSVFKGVEVVISPCGDIPTALSSVIRPLLSGLFWIGGLFLAVTAILQAFDVDLMIGRQGKGSN